jgi:FkbM family methyltransferase
MTRWELIVSDVMREVESLLRDHKAGPVFKSKQGALWKLASRTRGSFWKRLAFHLSRKTYKEWDNAGGNLGPGLCREFWPLVNNPGPYEAAWAMLADDESRAVFEWRLKVRLIMPFVLRWEDVLPAPPAPGVSGLSIGAEEEAFCKDFKTGQYLLQGICMPEQGDVVLDLGAYLGDSAVIFSRLVGPTGHVYSFEALPSQFAKLEKNLARFDCGNATACFNAAWNSNEELLMCENRASSAVGCGTIPVPGVRIDDFVRERGIERVDFIKMDIEGAEQEALEGCERTIREFTPKLALSAYHKPEDLHRIMEIVRDINPGYRFYMRHYNPGFCDTVLYAAP